MTTIVSLFWNQEERRLRLVWRLLLFVVAWILFSSLMDLLMIPPLRWWFQVNMPQLAIWLELGAHYAVYLLNGLAVTFLAARFLDRRPFMELGIAFDGRWRRDFVAGLLLGALLMTLIFSVEWILGWVKIHGVFHVHLPGLPFVVALIGPVGVFLAVGVTEELVFRGYLLRNFAEGMNLQPLSARMAVVLAWAASSVLFGLLHTFNPNSSWVSTLYLMLAGVMLGLPVVLTGSLAFSMALHISWNLFQGNVFGFPVSGNNFSGVTVLAIDQLGPDRWTGGRFGPEAGLVGVVAVLLGCVVISLWARRTRGVSHLFAPLAIYSGYSGRCQSQTHSTREIG